VARLYGWLFGARGGGREYPLFPMVVSVAVAPQGCAPAALRAAAHGLLA